MIKRIMALDVGDQRTGVALSDPLGITAYPLCTIEHNGKKIFEQLSALVLEHGVGRIIVGIPYELDGHLGAQGLKVEKFFARLKQHCRQSAAQVESLANLKFSTWDERFTTAQAERVLAGSGLKNRQRSAALDRVSAAIILESYLASPAQREIS